MVYHHEDVHCHHARNHYGVYQGDKTFAGYLLACVAQREASVGKALNNYCGGLYAYVAAGASNQGNEDGQGSHFGYLLFKAAKDDGVDDAADDAYQQPRQACLYLCPDGVVGVDIRRYTGGHLIVAFAGFAHLVHDVVDRYLTYQATDVVDYRHGHKVVFLEVYGHLVDRCVGVQTHRLGVHNVFYLAHRGVCQHFLQRQYALQTRVVVYHIDVIDVVHLFGLAPHFLDAVGHG